MNKKLFNVLITIMLVVSIFQVQSVLASYKKNLGDSCILDAECQSGWCINDKCVVNPCTDGKCDLLVDCHECNEVNGMIGDCQAATCGFETSKCYDGIIEYQYDCFCPNYGDASKLKCMIYMNINKLYLIAFAIGVVGTGIVLKLLFDKKTKRR